MYVFYFHRVRILVRAISYTVHGLIPASCVFADRYNREEVVRSLGKEINLNPPLVLGQLPDTPDELLKLDQVRYLFFVITTYAVMYPPVQYSTVINSVMEKRHAVCDVT